MFHILVSSKGGVGKSTLAQQAIAPMLFDKTAIKVRVIEVDDCNVSDALDSVVLCFKSFNVSKGIDFTQKSLFQVFDGEEVVVDAGGGNDTNILLDSINSLGIDSQCVFYIPVLKNKTGMKNLLDVYARIRSKSTSRIVIILNQVVSTDVNSLKNEFAYFFGSEELNIKGAWSEIFEDKNLGIATLRDTNVFDLAESYGLTAYEIGKDKIDVGSFLASKKSEGFEAFKKAMTYVNIYNMCKQYKEEVLDVFFKECEL